MQSASQINNIPFHDHFSHEEVTNMENCCLKKLENKTSIGNIRLLGLRTCVIPYT